MFEHEVMRVFALVVELDDHFAGADFGAGEGVAVLDRFDAEVADFGRRFFGRRWGSRRDR
jgi:hypothetical protein